MITSTITAKVTNIPPNNTYLSWETLRSMSDMVALESPSVFARSMSLL